LYNSCDNRPALADEHQRSNLLIEPQPAPEVGRHVGNPDFVLSLTRGLRVIESYEGHTVGRSVAESAKDDALSRASVRRLFLTLEVLGYAESSRRVCHLKTRVLKLGLSYLSSTSVIAAAQPVLERITAVLGESASMSILDGDQIVYVARSAPSRVLSVGLSVGSHLPAYCISMGRVLLAALPEEQLDGYLRNVRPRSYTAKTIIKPEKLRAVLLKTRKDGFALVNEELEAGLRALSVPVCNRRNRVVAAINIGARAQRINEKANAAPLPSGTAGMRVDDFRDSAIAIP
jgi:IclR family transcriptional regulator, pca regulon regulatory protein